MKTTKKLKSGTIYAALGFIGAVAVVVFTFLIFPSILADTPENREIETITPTTNLATENLAQLNEIEHTPNINAISQEQAIEIAEEAVGKVEIIDLERQDKATTKTTYTYARYSDGVEPTYSPVWYVIRTEESNEVVIVAEDNTLQIPVFVQNHIIEINALTGEVISISIKAGASAEDRAFGIYNDMKADSSDSKNPKTTER